MQVATVKEVLLILLSEIQPNNYNCNIIPVEEYERLKASMSDLKSCQPIYLRKLNDGKYEIIDGRHRWQAAKELGWDAIPSLIADVDEYTAKVMNYSFNSARGTLDPFLEAKLFFSLMSEGIMKDQICKDFKVSRDYLSNRLQLLNVKSDIRDKFSQSCLGLRHWLVISKFDDHLIQEGLALQAQQTKISAEEFEREAPKIIRTIQGISTESISHQLKKLEERKVKRKGKDHAENGSKVRVGEFLCGFCESEGKVKIYEKSVKCPNCGTIITESSIEKVVYETPGQPFKRLVKPQGYGELDEEFKKEITLKEG